MPKPKAISIVDGWPIHLASLTEAVTEISQSAAAGESFTVFTLNLDHLQKLRHSEGFRNAYATATYVTADGAPIAMLASRGGKRVERTTGADLVLPLSKRAAQEQIPVYLFGSSTDVLKRAAAKLRDSTNNHLVIAGMEAPPQGFDPDGPCAIAALDRIKASNAKLCFVALGAPKQELFAAKAIEQQIGCGFICIGAGLDFLANTQVRAPHLMQRIGLEWLWRLGSNPARLGPRYLRCALVLLDIALINPLNGIFAPRRT